MTYIKTTIVLSFLLINVTLLSGTTRYVKITGNDSYSGASVDSAWQTLTKACSANVVVPNDTILVVAGTYNENGLCPEDDSITIKAYPGAEVWVAGQIGGGAGRSPVWYIEGVDRFVTDSINVKYGHGVTIVNGLGSATQGNMYKNCTICSVYAGWAETPTTADMVEFMEYSEACTVQNCELYVTGLSGTSYPCHHNNCAIIVYADPGTCNDHAVIDNVVHNVGVGIWYKHSGGNRWWVHGNTVYDFCTWGIIAGGDSARIHHNLVYQSSSPGSFTCQYGIKIDDQEGTAAGDYSLIYNNTVDGMATGGICIDDDRDAADECSVWNNISCHTNGQNEMVFLLQSGVAPTNHYQEYNCWYDSSTATVINWDDATNYTVAQLCSNRSFDCTGSLQNQDPLFTNPGNGVYTLQEGSPCANSGRGGSYASYMGAFEYQAPAAHKKVLGKGHR